MNNQKSKHKIPNTKNNKGITLIALIITIIVLLILAVVAIGAVQNDGIIDHAKNARDQYGTAQTTENSTIQSYLDKIQEHLATGTGSGVASGTGNEEEIPGNLENSGTTDNSGATVTSITKILGAGAIEQGLTRTLVAYDQDNNPIPSDKLNWTSSSESKVTVSNGVVTGLQVSYTGVTITASSKTNPEEIFKTAYIPAVLEPILSVGISSGGETISVDGSVSLMCTTEGGEPFEWPSDQTIIWESGDSTIASVTSRSSLSATVTGIKAGTTTITAKHPQRENVTATITITVTE